MRNTELHELLQRRIRTLETEFELYTRDMLDLSKSPRERAGCKSMADALAGGILELAAFAKHLGLARFEYQSVEPEIDVADAALYPSSALYEERLRNQGSK